MGFLGERGVHADVVGAAAGVVVGRVVAGVASRLVEDLLATAGRKGVRRIELTANPHANAFYRHVGFVQGHDSETRLGGAPRMYLTLHGAEADQHDTGFDPW